MLPVTFKTKVDQENIWAVNRTILRDQQRKMLPVLIVYTVLIAGLTAYAWIRKGAFDFITIWACLIGVLLWLLFYLFLPLTYKSRTQKTLEALGVREETAVIEEDQMTTRSEGPKGGYEQSLAYTTFTKIWETPTYFLLYVGLQVLFLDKRSVSDEENAAVRAFFQPLFPGKKYRILK